MRLDCHQHFWKYDEVQYPWIPKGSALHRDWLPEDLQALQSELGLEGSIAVQARQSLEESNWLLSLAERAPVIRGVVGWVDLRHEAVDEQLAPLAAHPKFVGVRHVAQDEPDDRFLVGPEFMRGISRLAGFNLAYDLLVFPRQLRAAIELVNRFPGQRFVLDHLAKPFIAKGELSPWREEILELAKAPNVSCKLSGLLTEADHLHWRPEDFKPYLDTALEAFGSERLMFGSDWPVCLLAGSYAQTYELVNQFVSGFSASEREAVLGGNAARFYLCR